MTRQASDIPNRGSLRLSSAKAVRRARAPGLCIASLALSGCAALDHGFLAAAGPVAAQQRELFWIIAAILVFVGGPVLLLTPIMAWYYRLGNTRNAYRPKWTFSWRLERYIWIPPVLIAGLIAAVIYIFTQRLDPYRPLPGPSPLEVQVVALDWKWVFVYPQAGIASADRLVLPAGRPVRLTMTSGTVMQSLMIPRLSGQIYMMAGMRTKLNLQADRPGSYLGENTQYNGDGFARQKFAVDALPEVQFAAWLDHTRTSAPRWDGATAQRLTARSTLPGPQAFSQVPASFWAHYAQGSPQGAHATQHRLGPIAK